MSVVQRDLFAFVYESQTLAAREANTSEGKRYNGFCCKRVTFRNREVLFQLYKMLVKLHLGLLGSFGLIVLKWIYTSIGGSPEDIH